MYNMIRSGSFQACAGGRTVHATHTRGGVVACTSSRGWRCPERQSRGSGNKITRGSGSSEAASPSRVTDHPEDSKRAEMLDRIIDIAIMIDEMFPQIPAGAQSNFVAEIEDEDKDFDLHEDDGDEDNYGYGKS